MSILVNRRSVSIDYKDDNDARYIDEWGGDGGRFSRTRSGTQKFGRASTRRASVPNPTPLRKERVARAPPSPREEPTPLRKHARRSDPAAFSHLLLPTTASKARAQSKYVERKNGHGGEPSTGSRSVSPVATNAGSRLYALAMAQLKHIAEKRAESERKLKEQEDKLTFKPKITSTSRLLCAGGYRPPHECYKEVQSRAIEKRRMREQVILMKSDSDCTFRPTLTANSMTLADKLRKDDPFTDVGDRLCFEGGCRLVRQQLRRQIIQQREERRVISGFSISPRRADRLVRRLYNWQKECDRKKDAAAKEPLLPSGRTTVSGRRRLSSRGSSYSRRR
ncbi:hypothetical protein DPX39_090062600 [Trypanosoma brucei equiperdum]|uniref:Uncharacterized protein n=1 Tax=Trypanosoma brucei equiperdum TaxID=630700 RepID=A0A3L6L2X7_9TRYP|nr:hypothetical protein DPX39_090062600 [Trypanosoma brucei equiperdum]